MNIPNSEVTEITSKVTFVEIDHAQVEQRLDNFLLKTLKSVPKTRIYRIIRKGEVRVNKKRCKPEYKLQIGDVVRVPPVRIDPQHDADSYIAPDLLRSVEKAILFENQHLIVINKASGLAVHSGSGIHYGVIDIMRLLRPDTEIELVHRLDRDTSGCLLLAKHRQSLLAMQHFFLDNSLTKTYIAMVKGSWPQHKKQLNNALKKVTLANGERRVLVDPTGQVALTKIIDSQVISNYSLLTIELITGRTHQIRVHCQSEGYEIIGDTKYGDVSFNKVMKKKGVKRLLLHASRLELPRSEFSKAMVINADMPTIFNQLINKPG